jgi:hypothetical protein
MTQTVELTQKSDLARFARAHEHGPVTWRTMAGPGGTIIVIEQVPED